MVSITRETRSVEAGPNPAGRRPAEVLVVDDEPSLRRLLGFNLTRIGCRVETAATGEEALTRIEARPPDLVLLDLVLPGLDGIEVLRRVRRFNTDLPVVVLTANGSIESAVQAMKLGAQDFLTKPFEMERLSVAVRTALSIGQLARQVQDLRQQLRSRYRFDHIVGVEGGLAPVAKLVEKVIPTDLTVLIQGESGTGKELIARALHHEGPRKEGPFVALNCAALPESLLESELFGHEKGAFTGAVNTRQGKFELADGGTLLLDEVAEMSPGLQAKLLRAIQEQTVTRIGGITPIEVDVRILCATNRDLGEEVKAGRFREDLFYRIAVFPITLPPLRERREDIPALVRHVLQDAQPPSKGIAPEAMSQLENYNWPGNVRELQNVLRRAQVLAGSERIELQHLPSALQTFPPRPGKESGAALTESDSASASGEGDLLTLEEVEREHVRKVFQSVDRNLSQAARILGIGRTTLYRKLQHYGLLATEVS